MKEFVFGFLSKLPADSIMHVLTRFATDALCAPTLSLRLPRRNVQLFAAVSLFLNHVLLQKSLGALSIRSPVVSPNTRNIIPDIERILLSFKGQLFEYSCGGKERLGKGGEGYQLDGLDSSPPKPTWRILRVILA